MPELPIVKKIADMSNSFQPSHLPGMFDRLFVEEDHNEKSRPAD